MDSITIKLNPHYELLAELSEVPDKIQQVIEYPLDHQIKTYQSQKSFDLVLNTFPTGTGKTKAALLHLLDNPQANTLLIAPTNELIRQHKRDVEEFVKIATLPHIVCEVNAKLLHNIDPENRLYRQGERFYRLMTNPMEFAEQLGIPEKQRSSRCPIILITNPDLFYYSLYSCYHNLDKRNVFEAIFADFEYIIIDEFHYYNAKQLANFLFFIALSLELGYFQNVNRKMCLLSATPDAEVYNYLERLASQGLRWKAIKPEFVDSSYSRAVKTLTPVKLTFAACMDLDEYLKKSAFEVKSKVRNSLDGALISNCLIDINRAVSHLKAAGLTANEDFGRITGAVSRQEREISAKKPLILATPTVDIGYNFVKQAKTRQNLDFVFFTARYADEFWQRLGRVGRVLGKVEQDLESEAVALVSSEVLEKICTYGNDFLMSISRDKLKRIFDESSAFIQKPFLCEYISSYAILESFRPLYELRKQMRHPERIEEAFEQVRLLFAPGSKKRYQHYVYSLCRFNSLQKASVKDIYGDCLIREFLNTASFWTTGNENNPEVEKSFPDFKKKLQAKNIKCLEIIQNYVSEEYYALSSLFSFRDSFKSLTCAVYDPSKIFTDHEDIAYYDLFHLLKYYDLHWYSSYQDFMSVYCESEKIQAADLYCRVNRHKSKKDNLVVSFSLESTFEPEFFTRRYCDKPIAIKGFKLLVSRIDGSPFPLSPQLTEAIKDNYITCLLFPEQGAAEGEIREHTKDMQISYPSVSVTFPDSKQRNYKALLGINAYLVGARIQKYLYALEKKTEFWSSNPGFQADTARTCF
ncbi:MULTISPECIES: type I-D CRISPR-associated helicase Cas3' [Kamptonema]|uniref:type I-D CRISPR-associated helicase Cas3' n=1 Tax=Kamptonema TaxID=1501433 RepID=UPI0001DAD150|nr:MULTISPECIES: type I-D CRISPR-associated helicase Cas3' [Kamptonema]CBN54052.1 hypothetical protein OSCI_520006 [Kamptonema sp. PCC 6506]